MAENRSLLQSLDDKKLKDIEVYRYELYITRYKKCKFGLYICLALLILGFSIFGIAQNIGVLLVFVFLVGTPLSIFGMVYYTWKKRRTGLTPTQAVWHELAVAEEYFTRSDYESVIGKLQNVKTLLKNSKNNVLSGELDAEMVEYVETVVKSEKQKELLEDTFTEVAEVLITDLKHMNSKNISNLVKRKHNTGEVDKKVVSGIQGRIWDSREVPVKTRDIFLLSLILSLMTITTILFGVQAGMFLASLVMIVIMYLDISTF